MHTGEQIFRLNWDSNCHDLGFRNSTGELCFFRQTSNVTVTWDIPLNQSPGEYKLVHNGAAMLAANRVRSYRGESSVFTVEASWHKQTNYDHQDYVGYDRVEKPAYDLDEDTAEMILFNVILDTPW